MAAAVSGRVVAVLDVVVVAVVVVADIEGV